MSIEFSRLYPLNVMIWRYLVVPENEAVRKQVKDWSFGWSGQIIKNIYTGKRKKDKHIVIFIYSWYDWGQISSQRQRCVHRPLSAWSISELLFPSLKPPVLCDQSLAIAFTIFINLLILLSFPLRLFFALLFANFHP